MQFQELKLFGDGAELFVEIKGEKTKITGYYLDYLNGHVIFRIDEINETEKVQDDLNFLKELFS